MANKKPRANPKPKTKDQPKAKAGKDPAPSKPAFFLDPDRVEEIIAILIIILAVLTTLGALNLSGGFLLGPWTQLLRALLGWGVYLAPLALLGLGIWLIADALDRTWTIGWERPIGIGVMYIVLLAVLHIIARFDNLLTPPGAFQGGGYLGYFIASLVINAFGEVGAFLGLLALLGIALILLFNISLPELGRRLVYLAYVLRHLPSEIAKYRARAGQPRQAPVINIGRPAEQKLAPKPPKPERAPLPAESPTQKLAPRIIEEEDEPALPPMPRGPVSARIIGGASASTPVPVIQREWRLPEWQTMLEESAESEINQKEIRDRVHKIEETLAHFGVPAKVLEVNQGPTITQFGVEPGFVEQKGVDGNIHRIKVKVNRISALQHDLELALAAAPIRIEAPIPGKSMVGIEVPNSQIAMVSLRGVMESEKFKASKSKLQIALGQDVAGQPVSDDLVKMPHLLIAGATGSGKSVCVNAIIACLLCTSTPVEVQFVMIDPKRVELVNFNGIPHLRQPVVVEMDKAVAALQDAVAEMDRRFKIFAKTGARNIDIYHHITEGKTDAEKLPYLIVIVDELADLMMISPEEVERAITRLAQMARATGIHLILATQRPSVDVVTGLIKANFPSRISFAVTSQIDSRVVLDTPGAEKLLGRGDMLYMASDSSKLLRLQGCFVSDRELEKLVTYWKESAPPPVPDTSSPHLIEPMSESDYIQSTFLVNGVDARHAEPLEDDLLPQAIAVVQQSNRASVSLLQRKLKIGYSRAARLIDLLEDKGYVGADEGPTKGRAVLTPGAESPQPRAAKKSAPANRAPADDGFDDWTDEDWEDLDKE